jgi:hypothetical protein
MTLIEKNQKMDAMERMDRVATAVIQGLATDYKTDISNSDIEKAWGIAEAYEKAYQKVYKEKMG